MILRLIGKKTTWVGLIWILKGVVTGIFEDDWSAGSQDMLIGAGLIAGRDALAKLEG